MRVVNVPEGLEKTIFALSVDAFVVGPKADGSPDGSPVIDNSVGRTLQSLLKSLEPGDIQPADDGIRTVSALAPGYEFAGCDAGVILLAPGGEIAGLYAGSFGLSDIAVVPEHRGRGLGSELVIEYALRNNSLPTWDLEDAIYTSAGLAAHRRAWAIARERPELIKEKVEAIAAPVNSLQP